MRFAYNKDNAVLSAYVKKENFSLAAGQDEYRVYEKRITQESFQEFIKNYSNFIKNVFSSISPDEEVQDIVSISSFKEGFTWRSLIDLYYGGEKFCFLENIFSYALHVIKENSKKDNITLSEEDAARLQLIMGLIYMPSLSQPFKKGKKYKGVEYLLKKKKQAIDKKIISFEKKYKFDSKTMYQYYKDDEIPEKYIKEWIELFEQQKEIENLLDKQKLINGFISEWIKSS